MRCLGTGVRRISIEDRQHGPLQGSEKVKNRQMVDVPGVLMKGFIIKADTDMYTVPLVRIFARAGEGAGERKVPFQE
jgi:hypothetical protein